MNKTCVIAIKYKEPVWQHTLKQLEKISAPVILIDRAGVGNLSRAINQGISAIADGAFKYAWIITDVIFDDKTLPLLIRAMDTTGHAAIHPSFNSDHSHTRPLRKDIITTAPFCEFTAPIVRTDIMKQFPLNENMPYWGHDLDWGYRIHQAGHSIGIHHGIFLQHTYIRKKNQNNPITKARHALRKKTDDSTTAEMIRIYGEDWKKILKR